MVGTFILLSAANSPFAAADRAAGNPDADVHVYKSTIGFLLLVVVAGLAGEGGRRPREEGRKGCAKFAKDGFCCCPQQIFA